jgi:hypothetical protein
LNLQATGPANDGEVEDYQLQFLGTTLSGTVFYDDGYGGGIANDGMQNGGELGIGDVSVRATDGANTISATTDASGHYVFSIPASFSGNVIVSHTSSLPTGSSIAGATNAACLAVSLYDSFAAEQLIGDSNCSGAIDGAETGFVAHSSYSDYDFGVVRPSLFVSDQSGQTSSPGVIEYTHLYSPGTLGGVTVTMTGGAYIYQLFLDEDCDGSYSPAEGPHNLPYNFTVGSSWLRLSDGRLQSCFAKVRVMVPDGARAGDADIAQLHADLLWLTNPNAVIDTTFITETTVIVEGGHLQLSKEVRNVTQATLFAMLGQGKPGEVLEYRIIYANQGSDAITHIKLSDPVPFFTDMELNQYGPIGEIEVLCPDGTVYNLDTGSVTTVFVDISLECGIAVMAAGESGTVSYRVRIR